MKSEIQNIEILVGHDHNRVLESRECHFSQFHSITGVQIMVSQKYL